MDLKRDEVKYIRDAAKASYKKDSECYICGTPDNLQFHHFYSVTRLWEKWKKANKIIIKSVEDILNYRDRFRDDHIKEIYEETITLCKYHHMDCLHKVYGKVPLLSTAQKQKRWCDRQRDKYRETLTNGETI